MKALTLGEFLDKAPENFSNKYLTLGLFRRGARATVKALCRDHGLFEIYTGHVYTGSGCKRCGIDKRVQNTSDSFESVVHKARQVHGDTYEYLRLGKLSNRPSIYFLCKEHGEVHKTTNKHISAKQGCPKCSSLESSQNKRYSFGEYKTKALKVHGGIYNYKGLSIEDGFTYVNYKCKQHGAVRQLAANHLIGSGCNTCGYLRSGELLRHSLESFKQAADAVHGSRYEYLDLGINPHNRRSTIRYLCKKHGEHTQGISEHLGGQGCPRCSTRISKGELELLAYIQTIYPTTAGSYKYQGKKEIDIYIKDLNLGIEYDGLPWHSTKYKTKEQQLVKSLELSQEGIRLIRIFEDEWLARKEQIKEYLKYQAGKVSDNYYAADCAIEEISSEDAMAFHNYRQVKAVKQSSVNKALKYKNKVVAAISLNTTDKGLKLSCFSSAFKSVQASKVLIDAVIQDTKTRYIEAYMDNRLEDTKAYRHMGFNNPIKIDPECTYWKDGSNSREDTFGGVGYYQIYDDGLTKWELTV